MSRTALVTGASSGIGMDMARILAADGWDLVIVGRNSAVLDSVRGQLSALYDRRIRVIEKDLSEDGAAEEIYSEVEGSGTEVDFLINCAGFGDLGPFAECDLAKQVDMIHVNDISLTALTRLFLPGMVSRKRGWILNVASVASFQPGPLMSVYYASKAYVLSFTEALAAELRGTGVKVSALCPGPTKTGFFKAANADGENLFKESSAADSAAVAEYGIRMALKGKVIAVPGVPLRLLIFLERLLPRRVVRGMVFRIQKGSSPKK